MKQTRIIFMGTPIFAMSVLQKMLDHQCNVVAVVTVPDKPAGRGQKTQMSAVKQFAMERNIPVLQPENLKSTDFLDEIKSYNADLQVVVAFRMLPKQLWQMPRLGTFNLHASLLPDYRGAAPINWAIINGEKHSGVTTFLIDEKIDTGAILLQQSVEITDDETCGTLHDKLMDIGGDLVIKTIEGLEENTLTAQAQPSESLKNAPKIYKETCRILWNNPGKTIDAFVRGLSPYPAAWTFLMNGGQQQIKVFKGRFVRELHQHRIGDIFLSNRELGVYVPDGVYFIEEIQQQGKKKMNIKDFLNGATFYDKSFFM